MKDNMELQEKINLLEEENSRLLQANRDCLDHFGAIKKDYDTILAENTKLKIALGVMTDFAGSVGGSSSFWTDYWPQFDPDLD